MHNKFQQKVCMFKKIKPFVLYGSLIVLAGCASYEASSLSSLASGTGVQSSQKSEVTASWKVFDAKDCETYLGRDVLASGYVPIQMRLENLSNDPLLLSTDYFNVGLASPHKVAQEVHTSTATRVMAWGLPGLFCFPLL